MEAMKTILCMACGLVALMCLGCRNAATKPEVIRPVRAIKAGDLKAILGREFPGRAKAGREVDLSFRVSGPLVSLPVDVGRPVKKGEIVVAIDPRDFQTALDSAEGNLSAAQANLLAMLHGARPEEVEQLKAVLMRAEAESRKAAADHLRSEALLPEKAVSKAEFDAPLVRRDQTAAQVTEAKEDLSIGLKGSRLEDLDAKRAEVKALRAAVDNAKDQLDYTSLKAPFDVVHARSIAGMTRLKEDCRRDG